MYNQASIYKGGGVYNLGDGASTKLPANTLRFLFSKSDYDPTEAGVGSSGTWKKVSAKFHNVWDWTATDNSFSESFFGAFTSEDNLVSVVAAGDCSSVTSMFRMFRGCTSLVSCCLFDSSSVTTIAAAFFGCTNLKEIPQFETSSVIIAEYAFNNCKNVKAIPLLDTSAMSNVDSIFSGCSNVESGALALYTQMSTQTTPPSTHANAFLRCGANTTTGSAELAQIPASWGGTAPATLNMGAPQNLTEPLSPSVIEGDDSLTK